MNDGGGYILMQVNGLEISVFDGNSLLDHEDLDYGVPARAKLRIANQTISKKLNDFKIQGYELISSNSEK